MHTRKKSEIPTSNGRKTVLGGKAVSPPKSKMAAATSEPPKKVGEADFLDPEPEARCLHPKSLQSDLPKGQNKSQKGAASSIEISKMAAGSSTPPAELHCPEPGEELLDTELQGTASAALRSMLQELRQELRQDLGQDFLTVKEELKTAITDLRSDIGDLIKRQEDMEAHMTDLDAETSKCTQEVERLAHHQSDLWDKMEDLENRTRRNNLRIRGLPEEDAYKDCTQVVVAIAQDILQAISGSHDPTTSPVIIERAHRALRRPMENAPRDIVICFQSFPLKEQLLRYTRAHPEYRWKGLALTFFQDLSPVTLQRRRDMVGVTRYLRMENIKYRWLFPFAISFTINSTSKRATSVAAAWKLLLDARAPNLPPEAQKSQESPEQGGDAPSQRDSDWKERRRRGHRK